MAPWRRGWTHGARTDRRRVGYGRGRRPSGGIAAGIEGGADRTFARGIRRPCDPRAARCATRCSSSPSRRRAARSRCGCRRSVRCSASRGPGTRAARRRTSSRRMPRPGSRSRRATSRGTTPASGRVHASGQRADLRGHLPVLRVAEAGILPSGVRDNGGVSDPQNSPQPSDPERSAPVGDDVERVDPVDVDRGRRACATRRAHRASTSRVETDVTDDVVTVRRAPRYGRFITSAALVGAVVALILTFAFSGQPRRSELRSASTAARSSGSCCCCAPRSASRIGAVVALSRPASLAARSRVLVGARVDPPRRRLGASARRGACARVRARLRTSRDGSAELGRLDPGEVLLGDRAGDVLAREAAHVELGRSRSPRVIAACMSATSW